MTRRLVLAFVVAIVMSAAYAADIGVTPPRIAVTVPPGGSVSASFDVIWTGKKPVNLTVESSDWTMSENGQLSFLPDGESKHSASAWVAASADSINMVGPGQKTVRVSISVPNSASLAGTYHTVLFVETPPAPTTGAGTHLSMRQRVGVVVYVTIAGTEKNGSKLTDMFDDGNTVHAVVSNEGNTVMRYSGSIEVRDTSGDTVKSVSVGSSAILRTSERDIAVKMPDLPKGYYVLLLLLKDSRGGLLTGQLPYEVK